MSTKAIRDALGMAEAYAIDGTDDEPRQRARVKAALAEVEAIEMAAKDFRNEPADVTVQTWALMERISWEAP